MAFQGQENGFAIIPNDIVAAFLKFFRSSVHENVKKRSTFGYYQILTR